MYEFMQKSKSVFPNALLSKEDFQKDQWKRCMVFVFMARWVYGKDGQKQWRLFDMSDLKFNMRAFEMWKRMEAMIMQNTELYQQLPDRCTDPRKRKRSGRGRYRKGENKKGRSQSLITESSSASESPMKRVSFDLTAFSDDEEETGFKIRSPTPPVTESDDAENGEDDEDDCEVFNSDEGSQTTLAS